MWALHDPLAVADAFNCVLPHPSPLNHHQPPPTIINQNQPHTNHLHPAASIPVIGFNAVYMSEHFGAFLAFVVLHAAMGVRFVRSQARGPLDVWCFGWLVV